MPSNACGGGYEKETVFALFSPFLSKGNSAFYYNKEAISGDFSFNEQNLDEWLEYFKNRIKRDDLNYLLYVAPAREIAWLQELLNQHPPNAVTDKLRHFLDFAPKSTLQSFYTYLYLSKMAEPAFVEEYDSWDSPEIKIARNHKILSTLSFETHFLNCTDPLLKQRYGFQSMRKFYHLGMFAEAIAFYNQHLSKLTTENSIYYRTLGFLAACHYKLEAFPQANLIYASLFEIYPNVSLWSFHVVDEADWQRNLKMAQNDETKIKLWFMMGYYLDPLRAMKAIYQINPASAHLKELAARAINIQEELLFFSDKPYSLALNHPFSESEQLEDLSVFFTQVCQNPESKDPVFWLIACAHTAFLINDFETSNHYYRLAEKHPLQAIEENQIRIGRLLLLLNQIQPNIEEEARLFQETKWVLSLPFEAYPFHENIQYFIFATLEKKYEMQKEEVKAELCSRLKGDFTYSQTLFYTQPGNELLMLETMQKTDKSQWEDYLLSRYPFSEDDIIEWKVLQLIYSKEYALAAIWLSENETCMTKELYGDPFHIRIVDCHDCDHAMELKNTYSQRAFFFSLIALKKEVDERKGNVAQNAFLLANAFYNYTYYGNARSFYMSAIAIDIGYADDYFGFFSLNQIETAPFSIWSMELSKQYYQIAFDHARKKEQKAKICWMLAKCELNDFYNGEVAASIPDADFIAGPHMHLFATAFNHTRYYKEVIKECGYFRTFLSIKS
jgi:hypothetical protein